MSSSVAHPSGHGRFAAEVSALWRDVLGAAPARAGEDFFAAGGDSIMAAALVARVREVLGEVSLQDFVADPTPEGLARALVRRAGARPGAPALVPGASAGAVSYAQERFWFIDQTSEGSAVSNVSWALRLRGELDVAALQRALRDLAARHDSLRMGFEAGEAGPRAVVADAVELVLERAEARTEDEAHALAGALAQRPFELGHAPLLRVALLRLGDQDHVLQFVAHHIVCDDWTKGVLLGDLGDLYAAARDSGATQLPAPVSYLAFAQWQRERLDTDALARELEHWQGELAGTSFALELPTDRPRPPAPSTRGARLRTAVPAPLAEQLRALGRERGATFFMTMLAAFEALLHHYSGQDDFVVGTAIDNRDRIELETAAGLYTNVLALRCDLSGAPSFHQLLAQARARVLAAIAHQELPFDRLAAAVAHRDPSRHPVFQAFYEFIVPAPLALEIDGISSEPFEVPKHTSEFDLGLYLDEQHGGLDAVWEYSTDLFEPATIARMAGHFLTLLAAVLQAPDAPIDELELLAPEERERILVHFNDVAPPPSAAPVHERFAAHVAVAPGAPALVAADGALSYADLDHRADAIAWALRDRGVGAGDRVALLLDRRGDLIAGMLAVLKLGAAFVPLNPDHPSARLRVQVQAAGVRAVVGDRTPAGFGGPVLDPAQVAPAESQGPFPAVPVGSETLAYVLFTSGSTGEPKGVAVTHGNLANYTAHMTSVLGHDGTTTGLHFGSVSAVSTDLGNTAIFPALAGGGCLHLVASEIATDAAQFATYLESNPLDVLKITPSHLSSLLDSADPCALLPRRWLVVGGEALTWELAQRVAVSGGPRVLNHYGPTEATIGATTYEIAPGAPRAGSATVPIGRPISGNRAYLLSAGLRPVPVGVPGELWLGGAGVAAGYLGADEQTAARFVADPFQSGERIYRTGDLARWLPDGNIEFLGRVDEQVKIRGFRVEPAEVAAVLMRQPGVRQAAVLATGEGENRQLVGYVVGAEVAPPALQAALGETLPAYMVPASIVPMPALPLTPNGKLDRAALPAPAAPQPAQASTPEPVSELETQLAAIWSELLGCQVGPQDDFFELGGHSLLAIRLIARTRKELGTKLTLKSLMDASTVRGLAAKIEAVRAAAAPAPAPAAADEPAAAAAERPVAASEPSAATAPPTIPAVARDRPLRCSFIQEQLWLVDQLTPGATAYNFCWPMRVRGPLDVAALERAVAELVSRHEALRTRFAAVDGQPLQIVDPPGGVGLEVATVASGPDRERELAGLIDAAAGTVFDLTRGPLVHFRLLEVDAEDHVLVLVVHHIVFDGVSKVVLYRELGELYAAFAAGREPQLPAPAVQYADYAEWQRGTLDAERIEEELGHWRERLAGIPAALELPGDRPRPPVASLRGARLRVPLPRALRDGLERIAREQRTTFFTAVLAAFDVLLHRYSGQDDVIVGTPVDTRSRAELETVVGPFINTLVVRSDLSGAPTFAQLLHRVHERTLEAIEHHELPFERLVEALAPERDLSRHPIFQALLALNPPERGLELTGAQVTELDPAWSAARVDLFLILDDLATGMEAIWEYSTDLFEPDTVAQMARHFIALLQAVVADPHRPIDELVMVDEAERNALQALNATAAEIPPARLEVLIAQQAQRTPDGVAVQARDRSLTFAQLDAAANRLAHRLAQLGVAPEELVGVCLPRSEHLLVALLGVLKAGAAYVPIDPGFPAARRAFMLQDAQARVVVTEQGLAAELAATGAHLVCLDADAAALAAQPSTAPAVAAGADALAYVIYTSGSTGRPKGVEITHRNLVNFLASMAREPGLGRDDVLVAVTTLSFDIAGLELYLPLLQGARVVVATSEEAADPGALAGLLRRCGATIMQATPTTWRMLLDSGWSAPPAFRALCGGEAMPPGLADELLAAGAQPWNMYGPTETTIWSTVQPIRARGEAVTIGRPIANTTVHVLDRAGAPAPLGVPGELHIGGAGVARGYRGRPELTAERFIPDPFAAQAGARLYRTGDLVRLAPGGSLQFLGRLDHQIKLRGYRIELGEIEATLEREPGVAAAAATLHVVAGGEPSLVAYVVPADGPLDPVALTQRLTESLPAYMVPAVIVSLDALPQTPNGKLDRAALPAPELGGGDEEAHVAPRGEREALVANLFAEVLGVQRVGAGDDFFALGGQSLLAARLISRLGAKMGLGLPLRLVFEAPTVAALAGRLDALAAPVSAPVRDTSASPPPALVPVSGSTPAPAPAGPPPLLPALTARPASYAQERFWFIEEMGAGNGAYNISWPVALQGPLDVIALERALSELAARHEILRARFVVTDGRPVQVIDPPGRLRLEFVDLSAGGGEAAALAEVDRRTGAAFDLAEGPLIRAALLRTGPEDHVLHVVVHHIVADGWSKVIFFAELDALYQAVRANRPAPLAPLPLQYADFAQWQRSWLQGEVMERELAWWRAELEGVPASLELPSDRARPPVASMRGGWWRVRVADELVARLSAMAAQEGATFFMVMLSAYAVLLHRYSGQEDLVVGTPVDTRGQPALEQLIGPFVNTLALRVDAGGAPSFRDLLSRVRRRTLDGLEHQNLPFERLVEALAPERDLARHPLFQVLLAINPDEPGIALDGCTATELETEKRSSRVDLTLLLQRRGQSLDAVWEYSSDLFEPDTVAQMARHFVTLLESIADAPDRAIDELELLQAGERAELLTRSAAPDPGFDVFCLHERFAQQAALTPDAVAVTHEGRSLTYAQLDARANQVAHRLRELGVRHGALVALCLERSPDLAAAILGVLKAGGAYVPLDPAYPSSRLAFVLEDCQAPVLVTQESVRGSLPGFAGQVLSLDADATLQDASTETPSCASAPEDLAYVIYTSGSTGQPKGVMVAHRNVARLFSATEAWFEPSAQDTWSLLHSYAFDFSVWELWGALLYGGRVVVVPQWTARSPQALAELLVAERVTVLSATPSLFMAAMDELRARAGQLSLRLVVFGGEALSTRLLKPWYETFGDEGPLLVNMYGITETTVHVTYRPLSGADAERDGSPIGVPIPDLALYLLDGKLAPVPEGVAGELFVGGAGVARGYLNRPELTAERFLEDPFDPTPGARLYRTGDRARWRRDEGLHFEGRLDDQVKVRGFRIELGEIQAVLSEHPAVAECAVIARQAEGDVRLAAYVSPDAVAAPMLRRLLSLEHSGRLSPEQTRELPGGLIVAHANQRETDYLYEEIFASDSYFQHGIGLPPDACVFDVGANIGMFTLRVGLACPHARIFAFEPVPPVFSLLALNAELHGLNATLLDCGLGAARSEAAFTYFPFNSLISGRFVDVEAEREAVLDNLRAAGEASDQAGQELLGERMVSESFTRPLRTLSDVIAEHGVERIDLLKIDAERGELDVLAGIEDRDWAKIGQVVLEAHGPAGEVADIVHALQERGYAVAVERDAQATASGEHGHNIYAHRDTSTGRPPALPAGLLGPAGLRAELREWLADRLPEYMVPSAITLVDHIPLTANGKLDSRRLPAPTEEHRAVSTPPRSASERALAALWAELLGQDELGIDDDFFELGGHSLLAAGLAARMRDRLEVSVSVRDVFEARTIRRLAARLDQPVCAAGTRPDDAATITRRRPGEPWPLSYAQEQLWLIDQWDPGAPTYGVTLAFELEGPLDTEALERALQGVLERHEALRTVITVEHDRPVPAVLTQPRIELERCQAPGASEAEVLSLLTARAARPFDFSRDALLRATVIERAPDRHVLMLQTHHIAFDGWSEQVLLDDLAALYAGRTLPELPVQYGDFALWERARLQGRLLEDKLGFWRAALAGAPTTIELPTDHPRPGGRRFSGAIEELSLGPEVGRAARALCREADVTPYILALAALSAVLYRITGQDDILIGSPAANRASTEVESVIGFFSNTLVFRAQLGGDPSFRELLARVRDMALDVYTHQDVPLPKIVEALAPQRVEGVNPLFQVNLRVRDSERTELALPGMLARRILVDVGLARFDLALDTEVSERGVSGYFRYNSDIFEPATVAAIAQEFAALLTTAVRDPDRRVLSFELARDWQSARPQHVALAAGGLRNYRRRDHTPSSES